MREGGDIYKIGSKRFMGQKIGVFPIGKEDVEPRY